MFIHFLGTGAAEGIPAAYCRCDACQGVRRRGGIEIKSRASIRIDAEYQIDIPPDNFMQMLKNGIDMYNIRHLLITHSHTDHASLSAISDRSMSEAVINEPMTVYMSKPAHEFLRKYADLVELSELHEARLKERLDIKELDYFKDYSIGDMRVQTVSGAHKGFGEDETSINYLITGPDKATLLYALDTGYYTDESWEYLAGKKADCLVLDCTLPGRSDRGEYSYQHLDQRSFYKMLERMEAIGFVDRDTVIFGSHFNPHHGFTHYQTQELFDSWPYNVHAAYDGLEYDIAAGTE